MRQEIINQGIINNGFLGFKEWLVFLTLMGLSLSIGISAAQAQLPSEMPIEIKDREPSGEPLVEHLGNNVVKKSYRNKAGQIFKEVTLKAGKHAETKNILKIHPKGQEAEVEILTGPKAKETDPDDEIKLKTMQVITYDKNKNVIDSITYKEYKDKKPTERDVSTNGGRPKTEIRDINGNWVDKNESPNPKPDPKPNQGEFPPPVTPLGGGGKVSLDEAERRIAAHIKFIETRVGEMVAAYYYSGAQKTVEAALKRAGVSANSMTYAETWGKAGLGLFWSEYVKSFYGYHLEVLNKSRTIVQAKGYATKGDLEYLDNGMSKWKAHEQMFSKDFDSLVDNYTKLALVYDAKTANQMKYGGLMGQIYNTRPFDAGQYDAAKAEWARANKPLDQQEQLYGDTLQTIKDTIAKKAMERFFWAIDEKPS